MQQPQLITYADIAEVLTVTGVAACNQLLTDGWVLLGIYPLTTVADMTQAGEEKKQDTQRCAALGRVCRGKETRIVN
jgi:hypothetical protein